MTPAKWNVRWDRQKELMENDTLQIQCEMGQKELTENDPLQIQCEMGQS